ncbi:chaperone protein DnaJ-like isoform X2 [Hibiscus syriacus]|uniref:Chaperone protein DnaJ-like isoform X2 n=1 Tax=Hibiscus syriacus TaxID=106335 RepID=A0A6A3AYU6_HIBSY|nr:chaperone protein DnaJ-like isoform X2 [Hibiscus syriacus]
MREIETFPDETRSESRLRGRKGKRKNCANVTCDVFRIEEDFGRARVHGQFGNPELVQQAIDGSPVDCIHWTSAAQISLLEDEMRRVERVYVALMLSGMGSSSDVFRMEQAKVRMMQQKDGGKTDSYWTNLWGKPKEYNKSGMCNRRRPSLSSHFEEEVKEKARRAAGRWREHSKRGVDKAPSIKLPEALANKDN